jgi:hypothetical protein
MACDHANGAPWAARQMHPPQFFRKTSKESLCHTITRFPAFDQSIAENFLGREFFCHWLLAFVGKNRIDATPTLPQPVNTRSQIFKVFARAARVMPASPRPRRADKAGWWL